MHRPPWLRVAPLLSADAPVLCAAQITLPDGSTREGTAWETTPLQVAEGISKGLAQRVVVAKVFYADGYNPGTFVDADEEDDGEDEGVDTGSLTGRPGLEKQKSGGQLWDLTRPLEHDCTLHLLKVRPLLPSCFSAH